MTMAYKLKLLSGESGTTEAEHGSQRAYGSVIREVMLTAEQRHANEDTAEQNDNSEEQDIANNLDGDVEKTNSNGVEPTTKRSRGRQCN
jgi:hypothetical protein